MNQMHAPDFARQKVKELASVIAEDNSFWNGSHGNS